MERSTVNLDSPVAIKGLTIIPVVKTSVNCSLSNGISAFITKHPLAVVLVSPTGKKAFRISGEQVPLEYLFMEFPSIRESVEEA